MKQYILSVICAAVLCGIVADLAEKKGASAKILKLICGVFLSFTVIRPVTEVRLEEFSVFTADISQDAVYAADLGQKYIDNERASIITQEVTAYILEKAADDTEELTVDVVLDGDLIPRRITLTGEISPAERRRLEQIIETDLGIAKEDQNWKE